MATKPEWLKPGAIVVTYGHVGVVARVYTSDDCKILVEVMYPKNIIREQPHGDWLQWEFISGVISPATRAELDEQCRYEIDRVKDAVNEWLATLS